MNCPRRAEGGVATRVFPGPDAWRDNDTCSYCGSLNPDEFMRMVEAGECVLGTTDKNYKVYVEGTPRGFTKFYFYHLSPEQQERFVQLYNEKKLRFHPVQDQPGKFWDFYRLPFFMRRK